MATDRTMNGDLFALKRKSVTCCVTPCVAPRVPDCSFHSFPSEADVRSKWQKALSIDAIDDGMKVCGGHFCSEDFFPACAFKVRKLNVKRLKRTAVPSLFLPSTLHEEDAIRIVKVESLTSELNSDDIQDVSPSKISKSDFPLSDGCDVTPKNGVKAEPGVLAQKDQYSIETFCCTTCGLISNTEALFLEHLGTHVKNEDQNCFFESEEDPLAACLPEDTDYAVIEVDEDTTSAEENLGQSTEGTFCSEESWENDDENIDERDGKSDEDEDEEFRKFLSSENKFLETLINDSLEHVCFVCRGATKNIKLHLTSRHALHPAIKDVFKQRTGEKRRRFRRLVLVGDFSKANNTEPIVKAFRFLRSQESFEDFMRRRLPLLDDRLREFVFGIYRSRQIAKEGFENFSVFKEQRLFQGDGIYAASFKERKYKCSYCDFCSENKTLAVAHFHLHSDGKNFGCHCCQRYFDSFASLMSTHTAGPTCASIRPVDFRLRCDFCWCFFHYRKEYIWHMMQGYCLNVVIPCEWCSVKLVRRQMPNHTKKEHPGDR